MSHGSNCEIESEARQNKICFVYKEDYPWDVRVEKILQTLDQCGYQMSLICRNSKRLAERESVAGIDIFRIPPPPKVLRRIGHLMSVPFYFSPFWFYWIYKRLAKIRPNFVIVRDLPLMPIGIIVGKMLGIRVIFDMAESYPEMYASTMQFSDVKLFKFLFKNPHFAGWMEKISVRHADHTFVMIEESRDRLLRRGANPKNITIVSNTPSSQSPPKIHADKNSATLNLLYVGFVTRIRGIDNILHGIRKYLDSTDDPVRIKFDVVGIGGGLPDYTNLCKKLDIEDHVTFHGWCEQELVDKLYLNSDIGVLTYHVCSHWNHTIPNKLFDYMQAGMPVLATDVVPIKRIVEENECGMIFSDNDALECANCLEALSNPALRKKMGARGIAAIKSQYNWATDAKRMESALSNLLDR